MSAAADAVVGSLGWAACEWSRSEKHNDGAHARGEEQSKGKRAVILQNWVFIWLQFYLMHHHFLTLTFDWKKDLNFRYINLINLKKKTKQTKTNNIFSTVASTGDCSVAKNTADRSESKEASELFFFIFHFFFFKSFL